MNRDDNTETKAQITETWNKKVKQMDVLKDMPPGPLDEYRKQATFNWKIMALIMEPEPILRFKYEVWKTLENDPVFAHSWTEQNLEEERRATLAQTLRVQDYNFLNESDGQTSDPIKVSALTIALGQYDWSLSLRRGILLDFFTNAIRAQGTGKHFDYIEAAYKCQITGCVALTEISHGTNTRALRTKATYDVNSKKYIIHTPDFESAKCWSGNLGKTATHAYIMAQLYTPDGECHGLHGFVVPIRDMKTLHTFPGVTIFDMGAKLGLNGLDNGVMMFDNYGIPRDCLLNKTGDVTLDGQYITPFKDPNKRFGASLGNLSAARSGIIPMCSAHMCNALPIAIRYSAVRRQFGSTENNPVEQPVIEYQMQQWRLFPYLAGTYVIKYFGDSFFQNFITFVLSQYEADYDGDRLALMGVEIHILSSSGKALTSWLARDAIQECREACGGHGYLRASGFGRLRDDNDANCTYEGDNNVILQQTSNWLLSLWERKEDIDNYDSPLNTYSFLRNWKENSKIDIDTKADVLNPNVMLRTYKWLIRWLIQSTTDKFKNIQKYGKNNFNARNESQVYQARTLSLVFIEHYVLERFWLELCNYVELPIENVKVLTKLLLLYGLWSLEKHLAILYQSGCISGPKTASLIHEGILELCTSLNCEAVALADAIAPPDFILNSVIGNSDGFVYKHLQNVMSQTPSGFERASWWKDVVNRLKPKL